MVTTLQPVTLVRYPLVPRLLSVARVERVTPLMVRVTLNGDDLAGFRTDDAEDHVKLVLPPEGANRPVMPSLADSRLAFPVDQPRPIQRDYTPRCFSPERNELAIDLYLHGHEGPAVRWAVSVQPGHQVGVLGPRGSHRVSSEFDWYLLAGDASALPAIARRIEELPAGKRVIALIEVAGRTEEQEIATAADLSLTWLHRHPADRGASPLDQAIRSVAIPAGPGFVSVAGEANDVLSIRRYLLRERGFPQEWTRFSGHWKRGVVDYDHHAPLDDE